MLDINGELEDKHPMNQSSIMIGSDGGSVAVLFFDKVGLDFFAAFGLFLGVSLPCFGLPPFAAGFFLRFGVRMFTIGVIPSRLQEDYSHAGFHCYTMFITLCNLCRDQTVNQKVQIKQFPQTASNWKLYSY